MEPAATLSPWWALQSRDHLGSLTPGRPAPVTRERRGRIAVLPVHGVLVPHPPANEFETFEETLPLTALTAVFDAAMTDRDVQAIVLALHSPGGAIFGVPEFAERVYRARLRKRIVAIANHQAASAAYWIGAQASEFVVTPSGEVGSIGVFTTHADESKFWAEEGVQTSYIYTGTHKVEASPHAPLSDTAKAYMQRRIDGYYDMFVRAVARGRGVSEARVRETFGGGRMVDAKAARTRGMVDKIATLDEVVHELHARPDPVSRSTPTTAVLRQRVQQLTRH